MDTGQILADILCGGELKIHLVGVAGSGMEWHRRTAYLARPSRHCSDKVATVEVGPLERARLEFHSPNNPEAVAQADLVIYSSAIRPGHPDYDAAAQLGKNMVAPGGGARAIMNCKKGFVVAGMHGKTTTAFPWRRMSCRVGRRRSRIT
jgi:UDP-N-acetylmuramate-alanine ligase